MGVSTPIIDSEEFIFQGKSFKKSFGSGLAEGGFVSHENRFSPEQKLVSLSRVVKKVCCR
jgi:hypothetical protein